MEIYNVCSELGHVMFKIRVTCVEEFGRGFYLFQSGYSTGLSNTPVVSRRAKVGTRPICPDHSTLGHVSSRFLRAFDFRGYV